MLTDLEFVTRVKAVVTAYDEPPEPPPVEPPTNVRVVNAGENLSTLLETEPEGHELRLEPGATWYGNFVPRRRLRITTNTTLAPGRIDPTGALGLARIISPSNTPALRVMGPDITVDGITILANELSGGTAVAVGHPDETVMANQPERTLLQRIVVFVPDGQNLKRGLAIHGRGTALRDSVIFGVKLPGTETQGVLITNTPGPFTIENNFIEAASINILVGGDWQREVGCVPSDGYVSRNMLTKREAWMSTPLVVKNLFELKMGRRIQVVDNDLDGSWGDGQDGCGVKLTLKSSYLNRDPWVSMEDILFAHNRVRRVGAAMGLSSIYRERVLVTPATSTTPAVYTYVLHPSGPMRHIRIVNNLFECDQQLGVAQGRDASSNFMVQANGPIEGLDISENTFIGNNPTFLYATMDALGTNNVGSRFVRNIARHNRYGVSGYNTTGNCVNTCNRYFAGGEFHENVIAEATNSAYIGSMVYPGTTVKMPVVDFEAMFVDYAAKDFRVKPDHQYAEYGWTPGAIPA
jgi:hypothetical protein